MDFLERHPFLRELLFWIAFVFAYAGIVNYSKAGLLPALPFIYFMLSAAMRWEGHYMGFLIIALIVGAPLFYLKTQHGPIFHPALGRLYLTTRDVCFNKNRVEDKDGIFHERITVSEPFYKTECVNPAIPVLSTQFVPRGLSLKVDSVKVSNSNFDESYIIVTKLDDGTLEIQPDEVGNAIQWLDGRPVTQNDLRRDWFYLPARLMWWPKAPLILYQKWKATRALK